MSSSVQCPVMYRVLLWCVLCMVPAARAVVGGAPAAPPEPDAAVIFAQKYGRSTRLEGIKNDKLGYYSFFGIKYAEPPVGPRRFQRPTRRFLAGELTAKKPCLPCPQADPTTPGRMIGHEDCLCLNVFAPKMPGEETGCPVVFFIHGGNYRSGSASAYGGQHFAQKDTIIVTAQYRLGSLGYLSTGQRDVNGNLGLFDLQSAMAWINDYIEFFGGDRNRVVLMGQGSGGSAASLLALSPQGRSATGVAALSGTPLSPGAVRSDPAAHASALANHTGCPQKPPERLVMCLRQMPVEKVIKADTDIKMDGMDTMVFLDEISGRSGAGARVEGSDDLRGLPPIIEEKPTESLNKKEKRCPLLTGVNSAETSNAVFGKYNKFLASQLQNVKDFIKKDVLGGLQNVVNGVEGLIPFTDVVNQVLPLGSYYQAVFEASTNAVDGLSEIAEATGDALFNFPAFATVKSWSSNGEAFLYSFEHVGNLSKGSFFLPGMALSEPADVPEQKGKTKGPAHGDELAYLFEPLNPDGQSKDLDEMSSTDARVRDNFVSLIAKFAHGVSEPDQKKKRGPGLLGFNLAPFSKSDEKDQFLKITDTITVEKDFRFCQMGIWGKMADRLTGALCKNLITDVLTKFGLPLDKIPGQEVLGGILGNGQKGNPNDVPLVGGVLGNNGNVGNPQKIPGGLGSVGGLLGNNGNSGTGQMTPEGLGSAGSLLGNNMDSGTGQIMPGGLGSAGSLLGNNVNTGTGQMLPGGLGSSGGLLGNNGNEQMMPGGLGNVGGLFGGGGQRVTKPPRRRTTSGSRFPFDF